jgi:tetratricopeptide (TPR) repeat protein
VRAAALFLLLAAPPPQLLEDAHQGPSPWYTGLVQRYRAGDRGAVAEPFPPEKALYEVSALQRLAEAARRCPSCPERVRYEAFPFEAAVLLHTDRALARIEQYDPAGPAEMEVAPKLVAVMPAARRAAFEPRWVRAAALALSKSGQWDIALALLEPARERYAPEPLLDLARGAILESKAWVADEPPEQVEVPAPGAGRLKVWRAKREARQGLSEAERSYRAALALRPELAQARIRLGRILYLLGKPREATAELQAAAKAATDAADRYLAHLFLGRARESTGDWAAAIAEYEEATRAEPDGQAAAVALSYALHRAGRGRDSVEALRNGVDRAGRRRVVDPWWPYLAGQCEDSDALLDALRAEVAR